MWCLGLARLVRRSCQGVHVGKLRAELHTSVLDTGCDGSSAQPARTDGRVDGLALSGDRQCCI